MGIWIVGSGDIECDTCHKIIGRIEYDKNDGDFLENRVKIACNDCASKVVEELTSE